MKGKIVMSEMPWNQSYKEMINRNIGLISEDQQELLRRSKIAIFGMGGIGGTVFEVLVRTGVEKFSIVDHDAFETSNLNRQILATRKTTGKPKVEAGKERALEINPDIDIECFDHLDESNITEILKDAHAAVLAIDILKPCLIVSRAARKLNIPLIEGWAIPFGNVRTFTADTPSLEEAYGLPTIGRAIDDIDEETLKRLGFEVLLELGKIEGIPDFYSDEVIERIAAGHIPSFAPMVWLTSVLMALETIKVLLHWGNIAFAPQFTLYDPFGHRIPQILTDLPASRQLPE